MLGSKNDAACGLFCVWVVVADVWSTAALSASFSPLIARLSLKRSCNCFQKLTVLKPFNRSQNLSAVFWFAKRIAFSLPIQPLFQHPLPLKLCNLCHLIRNARLVGIILSHHHDLHFFIVVNKIELHDIRGSHLLDSLFNSFGVKLLELIDCSFSRP